MGFVTDALGLSGDAEQSDFKAREASLYDFDYTKGLGDAFGYALNAAGDPRYNQVFDAYSNQIAGKSPSVAENQLNKATGQNVNRAMAMAASRKGVNPALAAKMGIDAGAEATQTAAGDAAILRAQEQQAAQAGLANALAQRQAGTTGLFGSISGAMENQNQLRLQNAMQAQGMNASTMRENAALRQRAKEGRQKAVGNLYQQVGSAAMTAGGAPPMGGGGGAATGGLETTIPMAGGGLVPGDHPANDIVPAMLSPGEIVIPRSITQSPDAAKKAMQFVEAIKNSKRKK